MSQHRGDAPAGRPATLTLVDACVLALALVGLALTWSLQTLWVPTVARMFQDFGGTLPRLTRAAIQPVLSAGGTVLALVIAAPGLALRTVHRRRRHGLVLLIVAMLVALVTPLLLVLALYLPIFLLASAVR